jgi:dolichol-phosphate mannosyltransferase
VVPIRYEARPEGSETNLRPFRDGGRILVTLYRLTKTNNPLFYFGSVGTLSLFVGLCVAAFVGYEWFVRGIGREALAVVAASGILLGVQLIIFGVLSDIIVTVNREQTRRLEELAQQLSDENSGEGERRDSSAASIEAETGSFDDIED